MTAQDHLYAAEKIIPEIRGCNRQKDLDNHLLASIAASLVELNKLLASFAAYSNHHKGMAINVENRT